MIRGKSAGVKVVKGSGEPGYAASVQLRGATSINASGRSQAPLYIVDGIIIDPSVSGSPMGVILALMMFKVLRSLKVLLELPSMVHVQLMVLLLLQLSVVPNLV